MKLIGFDTRLLRFSPKRLFRAKDRSTVSRSEPSSFSSGTSCSSSDDATSANLKTKAGAAVAAGSATPTSILPEAPGGLAEISIDVYSELVQAFKMIDRDNDGVISRSDLEALLCRLGPEPPSRGEVKMMLSEVDSEGIGWISLDALASHVVASEPSEHPARASELREAFEFFDADHDGRISAEELLRVFAAIGDERCTIDDCRRMIAGADRDGDGFVCFDDFSRMMDLRG